MRAILSRLAVRIYLIGLAQIAIAAAGVIVIWHAISPREIPNPLLLSRYVADSAAAVIGNGDALTREIDRARLVIATVDIFDEAGAAVVLTSKPTVPRCWTTMPEDGATTTLPLTFCFARRTTLPDGRPGYITVKVPAWPPLPTVVSVVVGVPLIVIAVSSLLLGRALSHPLRRMSATARAFGDGQLGARVALRRSDELGEVARAFDDMAERVANLLRAERELMANISHELRTPLARIHVAMDLATEGDADVARESLKDIADDLSELERLIGDVLTAARLDLGESAVVSTVPPMRRQRVEVQDLVDRATSRFRAAHPERELLVELAADDAAVDGDVVLLRRVLDNLLENANTYSERPEDAVVLRVDAPDSVRIHVVDRGLGIAPEDLMQVFRPFFRADRSRTRNTGGLGLGLVLVRRIVEAHGGTVRLESTVGQGTTATVHLPRARRDPSPAPSDAGVT